MLTIETKVVVEKVGHSESLPLKCQRTKMTHKKCLSRHLLWVLSGGRSRYFFL